MGCLSLTCNLDCRQTMADECGEGQDGSRCYVHGDNAGRLLAPNFVSSALQPKVGQCPSGYRESGGYCAPTSDRAPNAVPKRGQCPSGYAQSGNYCIEMRRR
jgi:hypothetical protein